LDSIAELLETGSKPIPTLQVGKKSILVNSDWFTEKGSPLVLTDAYGTGTMMHEDEEGLEFPYDCCFHQDGNVADLFTQLNRLQLLQVDAVDGTTSRRYVVIQKSAFLDDFVSGRSSAMSQIGQFDDKTEAVTSFQDSFKENVGYTWKNRATCKPKKGSALVVDLETFSKE
jgi:hypothetical protein